MDVVHARCAGIDLSKKDAKVCVRVQGRGGRASEVVTTWGSMTHQILALREHLVAARVTCVVMEATSDYWKPFFYLLEDLADEVAGCEVMLVNAREAKNLPGRKTDVCDARWLSQLGAHGLVRASFVPAQPIRELRDLTRTRTVLSRDRGREAQRMEKLLEDAGIKLSSVATDIMGASGRAMIEALIAAASSGTPGDPRTIAELAKGRMRVKIPVLVEALNGRFTRHHAFLARTHLDLIDSYTTAIEDLTAQIEVVMEPFRAFHDLICSIPGISTLVADVVTAETGANMDQFPTPQRLASWAGVCPGHHESAGRVRSSKTRPGNSYLKGALGTAALSNARRHNTYYSAQYKRIAAHRGNARALVAVEHSILTTIWHMAHTGALYEDPGPHYYQRRKPAKTLTNAVHQLQALGYEVTLTRTG